MQAQQQEQQLQQSLSASGGDLEAAMAAALKAGRVDVAAKLAPIIEARRKSTAPRVVSPGSQVLGPDNEVLHQAPFKPDAPQKPEAAPSDVRMIEYYNSLPDGDPRKAILKKIIDAKTRAPEKTFPVVTTGDGIFERRPEGLVRLNDPKTGQPLRPTARERPITEFQGKNALYGARALDSDKTLTGLEDKINLEGLATKQALQSWPVVGGVAGVVGNYALSQNQQAVEQAQRNFVNAVLRQESGAVISEAEFENAKKQYFPQPGDKKNVIEQKRRNRQLAIQGFKKIAGPAWDGVEQSSPEDILNQADAILNGN